jgi:hypothetical protein
MKRNLVFCVLAASMALASCATVADAPVGGYAVDAKYDVTLTRHWADISAIMNAKPRKVHLLSIDGPLLNRLYITEGLSPGDYIVKPTAKDKPTPIYRADLSPTEVVEFVADSVAALDYQKVVTTNLRPQTFSDGDALRFDIMARTVDGLDVSGTALASETHGQLFVILYLAPTEHYYGDALTEVEAIMRSAKVRTDAKSGAKPS